MEPKRILIYCPLHEGGIAENNHYQANSLFDSGIETSVLTCNDYRMAHSAKAKYHIEACLIPPFLRSGPPLIRSAYFALATILNDIFLVLMILRGRYRFVLLASTSETLSILRVWPHVLLRAIGVRYAANIHDPQRKLRRGPMWLHRLSIRASFLPIEFGLVHEDFGDEQPDIPRHVKRLKVPFGCIETDISADDGMELKNTIAPEGKNYKVFLSFGYISDHKNIDISIRAISELPKAVLVIAGRVSSRSERPANWYTALAEELNCVDRVKIFEGFVYEGAVREYFGACDAILLTYSSEFVSQSGVLMLASNWSKPVLASSGPGPLVQSVKRFNLGPVVAPGNVEDLRAAMQRVIDCGYPTHGWAEFRQHASWERNVNTLLDGFGGKIARGDLGAE